MQTVIVKRRGKKSCRPYRGSVGNNTFTGRSGRKKDYTGRKVHRSGFLKQTLDVIPVKSEMYKAIFDEYLTEKNFNYLTECAVHYAGVLNKTIEIPRGTIHERICMLYSRFEAILPDGEKLNFGNW